MQRAALEQHHCPHAGPLREACRPAVAHERWCADVAVQRELLSLAAARGCACGLRLAGAVSVAGQRALQHGRTRRCMPSTIAHSSASDSTSSRKSAALPAGCTAALRRGVVACTRGATHQLCKERFGSRALRCAEPRQARGESARERRCRGGRGPEVDAASRRHEHQRVEQRQDLGPRLVHGGHHRAARQSQQAQP
jgi:hypothetical protein